jgi:hypothetical protein
MPDAQLTGQSTNLSTEEVRWRVHVGIVGRHVDETVNVVLSDCFRNTLGTINVNILVREVPIKSLASLLTDL